VELNADRLGLNPSFAANFGGRLQSWALSKKGMMDIKIRMYFMIKKGYKMVVGYGL